MSEYRRALAVLAGQCPLAAQVLVLRYVSEWSEREVAAACELSVHALCGALPAAQEGSESIRAPTYSLQARQRGPRTLPLHPLALLNLRLRDAIGHLDTATTHSP